jgi:cytochrome c5
MSQEQDRTFFRNYSIVIGIIAVAMAIFFVIAQIVGGRDEEHASMRVAQTKEITKPAGEVNVAGESPKEAEPAPAPAPAAAEPATATPTPVEAGPAVESTADAAAPAANADPGKKAYEGLCFSCHGSGLPMVPQFKDKAAWAPRIAQGKDVLYTHALGGFTGTAGMPMPAKGGNPALTDDEVKAAVDYMVSNAQ